jgi:hypothetical protein
LAKNTLFITGPGRCGTKTWQALFDQLPRVLSTHERDVSLIRDLQKWGAENRLDRAILEQSHLWWGFKNTEWLVNSSPFMWMMLPSFLEWFPSAKWVWLTRDIISWSLSAYRRGWYFHHSDEYNIPFSWMRPYPRAGWPPNANHWLKLGYLYGLCQRKLAHYFSKYQTSFVVVDVSSSNNLEFVNGLVGWAGFKGIVKHIETRNIWNDKITYQELVDRGLLEKVKEKMGLQMKLGAQGHVYSWIRVSDMKRAGLDIEYEPTVKPKVKDLLKGINLSFKQDVEASCLWEVSRG